MSSGTKRPYAQMKRIADALIDRLEPACMRIAIAGSLRRQAPLVSDIEIMAIPDIAEYEVDLFGGTQTQSLLNELLDGWLATGKIQHTDPRRWGNKLRAFTLRTTTGETHKVDLFMQPDPATWGVNMMIRTGPWEFSKWMVTPKSQGGAMPDEYRVQDARVWHNGAALDTPDEIDVFDLWGMKWIQPQDRRK